jgi:hypothetical protein
MSLTLDAPVADHDAAQAAQRVLADRATFIAQRLADQLDQRSRRKANFRNYPIGLNYRLLTQAQQTERREAAEDVVDALAAWYPSPLLSERQRTFAMTLLGKLRTSRGRYGMSPAEWEGFWALRDFILGS